MPEEVGMEIHSSCASYDFVFMPYAQTTQLFSCSFYGTVSKELEQGSPQRLSINSYLQEISYPYGNIESLSFGFTSNPILEEIHGFRVTGQKL